MEQELGVIKKEYSPTIKSSWSARFGSTIYIVYILYKELLEIKNMMMETEDPVEELRARIEEILQRVDQTVENKRKVLENWASRCDIYVAGVLKRE